MSLLWIDRDGQAQDHQTIIARAARSGAVLLGERHDRADHHRWQLHMAAALSGHRPVSLGFEMFPARVDPILAEWVGGTLDEDAFLSKVGWQEVWGFPAGLYLPLFRFCREQRVPMFGLNVARDLVRRVGKSGWDSVPEAMKEGLSRPAPSPAAYRRFIFELTGGARSDRAAKSHDDPAFDRFLAAQEVWDRAFATRILEATRRDPGRLPVGIIGMGHLQFGGGVSWQMRALGADNSFTAIPVDGRSEVENAAADATFLLADWC